MPQKCDIYKLNRPMIASASVDDHLLETTSDVSEIRFDGSEITGFDHDLRFVLVVTIAVTLTCVPCVPLCATMCARNENAERYINKGL